MFQRTVALVALLMIVAFSNTVTADHAHDRADSWSYAGTVSQQPPQRAYYDPDTGLVFDTSGDGTPVGTGDISDFVSVDVFAGEGCDGDFCVDAVVALEGDHCVTLDVEFRDDAWEAPVQDAQGPFCAEAPGLLTYVHLEGAYATGSTGHGTAAAAVTLHGRDIGPLGQEPDAVVAEDSTEY